MDISSCLRRVARGKNGAEHLERREAEEVLATLFAPDADALQLGAFLIAQRMKGETAEELAGFVDAARRTMDGCGDVPAPSGAVDLPCYAGKRRAAPLHLFAALKARDAGVSVLVHGIETIDGRISAWQVLQGFGVARAGGLNEAAKLLARDGIAYLDLADTSPALFQLLQLRPRLGVRSFAHTVARLLNPLRCSGQLNGVFHTPYAQRMARTNQLLGQTRSLLFSGAEGEPELYADRQKVLMAQDGEKVFRCAYPQSGHAPYPRQPVADLKRLVALDMGGLERTNDARKHAVCERMQQAFAWVAGGGWPADWTEQDNRED